MSIEQNPDANELINELRMILGKLKDVVKIQEKLGASYFIVVKSDEVKNRYQEPLASLMEDAQKHNFDLNIVCLTEEQLQKAAEAYEAEQKAAEAPPKTTGFKFKE